MALAFPDTYEVGMSHLGFRILYHLINEQDGFVCERAFAPWTDMEALLRDRNIPLCSQESLAPLSDFDMLGFSLTYELCYTNVLNILDLAGIPLLAKDREEGDWPIVIGGGPCASNPEPIAPFFDAFLFGEGEEAVIEICNVLASWKEGGGPRENLWESLSDIPGVYVPALFEPEYLDDGRIKSIRALRQGYEKVARRIVPDLETAYFPDRPMVPVIEPVHDRIMIEIARGCSKGCRFCHAGVIYRPVRERSVDRILTLARQSLALTGYEECSLLSLSVGDYSCISEVLTKLIREHYASRVSVSLPSMRVQGLNESMLRAIESVRKTGFTLAPEAGTERLRKVINKDYCEDELLQTAHLVFSHGWRNLKLYFMIGLPTEVDEDIEGIIRLGKAVSQIRGKKGKPQVTISISGFVPKPHTPFQWEGQAERERLFEIKEKVRSAFAGRGRRVKWQDPKMTQIEGVFSRGDRRLHAAIRYAFQKGQRFDGWSEFFNYEGWQEAFSKTGIDSGFYTGPKALDETLPWDHLDPGVSRQWLLEERERAYREQVSPDCRQSGCVDPCGVCDHETIKNIQAGPARNVMVAGEKRARERSGYSEVGFRYRVRYARRGDMRFMGQLEVTRLFNRAVRRASFPMRYSQGYHPLPRIRFGPSPPVGVLSEAEYVDLELTARVASNEVKKRLQEAMPEGIEILETDEIHSKSAPVTAIVSGFDYTVVATSDSGIEFGREEIERFMAKESVVITQKREKGDRDVDLRSLVKYLETGEDGQLRMGIRVTNGPGVKPYEVVSEVFGLDEGKVKQLEITRTEARFKDARPLRYPGSGERVRKGTRGARRI